MSCPAIVRIKRKRTEEPHDALVITTKKAKVQAGGEVFKYAETVEEKKFFDDAQKAKDLQDRIASLSRVSPAVLSAQPSSAQTNISSQRSVPEDHGRSYTIVNTSITPVTPPDEVAQAPSIAMSKDPDFQMYDAVLETPAVPPSPSHDAELAAFLPMLQEYLRLNDTPAASILPPAGHPPGVATPDEDYVWDVYYLTSSEWANLGNVATVNGVPPWILEGAMIDDDSDTDSMRDDEDEDSNAEDFYQNDYPDEDFHFSSDDDNPHDSEQEYVDDEEQHDWR